MNASTEAREVASQRLERPSDVGVFGRRDDFGRFDGRHGWGRRQAEARSRRRLLDAARQKSGRRRRCRVEAPADGGDRGWGKIVSCGVISQTLHRARRGVKARSCTCPASLPKDICYSGHRGAAAPAHHKIRMLRSLKCPLGTARVNNSAVRTRCALPPSLCTGFARSILL